MYDLGHHAQPIDAEQPCGLDCEYDSGFLALSQAVAGKPEQQFGDTVIAAVEPDWRVVEQMAIDLLGKTKDLRVVAWLTQAATHLHGIPGFAAGVELMNLLCEAYWDDVHPRLVIDGDNDPYLRIGALASLSDSVGSYSDGSPIMRAFRDALITNRAVDIRIRDVELAATNDASSAYSEAQIVSALKDAVVDGTEAISAFDKALVALNALGAQVSSRMAGQEQPDFSAIAALMKSVNGVLARAKSLALPSGDAEQSQDAGFDAGSSAVSKGGASLGDIRSREDVRRVLQRVCAYLEQHEPSNPASLFARRAERMLGMDFIDIVRELSPESMPHIQMLTGVNPADAAS